MISDISEKIKLLCDEKRISINQLAKDIGMSSSLHTTLKKNSISVETLMKISEVLGVPITSFFEEDNDKWPKSKLIDEVKKLDEEIEALHKRIDELEQIIRAKRSVLRVVYTYLKLVEDPIFSLIKAKPLLDDIDNAALTLVENLEILDDGLKDISKVIDESEKFGDEPEYLKRRIEERERRVAKALKFRNES